MCSKSRCGLVAVLAVLLALVFPSVIEFIVYKNTVVDAERWPGPIRLNNIRGMPATAFISEERIAWLENGFVHRPGDIWVATYAKSGTTWTQTIMNQLNGWPVSSDVFEGSPWPEPSVPPLGCTEEALNARNSSRVFKSHWQVRDHMTPRPGTKYIYVMRNVMDVAYSFYLHTRSLEFLYNFSGDFDEFFEQFIKGNVDNGLWFDHIAGWWSHRNDENVLWLRYEDMKADPAKWIKRMAEFSEIPLTEERLAEIVHNTDVKNMKKTFAATTDLTHTLMFWLIKFRQTVNGADVGTFGVRKGIVGDSKSHISEAQRAQLEALYKEKLEPLGVPRDWVFV